MTAALEGGEGSAARPGRTLPPGKTRYPLYRRLGGPQGRSWRRKISPYRDSIPGPSSPYLGPYTDWATSLKYINIYLFTFDYLLLVYHVRTAHQTTRTGLALCRKKLNAHGLEPNGYYPHHHVSPSRNLHPACRVYLCVLYGPQNKERLISYSVVLVTKTKCLNCEVMAELLYTILVHDFRRGASASIPG